MEGEVAAQDRMGDGIMLALVVIGWVDGFHAHVEAKDEIVEIESHTQTIGCCYLLVELVYLELSPWLVGVISQCPNITGVNEQGPVELHPLTELAPPEK